MALTKRWKQRIELWQNSGLSQAGYCQQEGLNRKTFSTRLSEFRSSRSPTPPVLIPMQVEAMATGQIVLRHTKGHRLELPASVPVPWLGELLRCLGQYRPQTGFGWQWHRLTYPRGTSAPWH
ncbi:IS66 family insertion sequence element accessory protein TnpB [Methyloglobulus sp.]|uniref:IS66 family insertion sequence element accessory protein TnpA n=1 Tax=Methyloglobulus sp. TaxID=2518622 RepID=UPI0032B7B632